jgi:hypothetical protein
MIAVIWLMIVDNREKNLSSKPNNMPKAQDPLTTSQLLKNIGAMSSTPGEKKSKQTSTFVSKILRLKPSNVIAENSRSKNNPEISSIFSQITDIPQTPPQGTAALRIDENIPDSSTSDSELKNQKGKLEKQILDLQEKINKLEVILAEKNNDMDNINQQLSIELKNRKDFNKIKDILEKELKDSKERNRNLEIELTNTQTTADSGLKRVSQLEDKIKKIEIEAREKTTSANLAITQLENENRRITEIEETLKKTDALAEEKDSKISLLVQRIRETIYSSTQEIKTTPPTQQLLGQAEKTNQLVESSLPQSTTPNESEQFAKINIVKPLESAEEPMDDIQKMLQLSAQIIQKKSENDTKEINNNSLVAQDNSLPFFENPKTIVNAETVSPHNIPPIAETVPEESSQNQTNSPITAKDILKSIENDRSISENPPKLPHEPINISFKINPPVKSSSKGPETHLAPDILEEVLKKEFSTPSEEKNTPSEVKISSDEKKKNDASQKNDETPPPQNFK